MGSSQAFVSNSILRHLVNPVEKQRLNLGCFDLGRIGEFVHQGAGEFDLFALWRGIQEVLFK